MEKDFFEKVYEIVARIPAGKVTTYGAIAERIGMRSSARMVGYALNSAMFRNDLPCWRVVNRLGELSGQRYFPTPNYMREALKAEGVPFVGDAVDIKKCLWIPD